MSRTPVIAVVAAFVLLGTARGQDLLPGVPRGLSTPQAVQELSEKALDRLKLGEVEGFDLLREHSVELGSQDVLDRFFRSQADRVKSFVRKWGKPLKVELIARQNVGDSFLRYIYLCKYEQSFLRWVFTYYRPKDEWMFYRLDFDDDVSALFEDARTAGTAVPVGPPPRPKPQEPR